MKSIHFKSATLSAAMIALAAPAFAQDACAGMGASGQWIGGSADSSDISTADNYREQMALVLGGNEYVSLFTLSQPSSVRIEAEGRGAGDPLFDVIGPDGVIIMSDDDSGGNGASRAELDLNPGTYCVSTRSYDASPMTAFVRIGRTEQEALTAGVEATSTNTGSSDAFGGCGEAESIGTLAGTLTNEASVDAAPFFRFTLAEPQALSITAENEDADPVLTLYDGDENYINENDDSDGLNSRLDITDVLAAGDYCIGLDALNDTSLPILVTIGEYDPEAALLAMIDRGEASPPMDGSVPIENLGVLETRLRADIQSTDTAAWYSVDVDQGGLLLVEAISAGGDGDPWLVVFDDFGRQVGQNDDYGGGLDALVTARINPGTYLIGVKEVTSGAQSFTRLVFERYVLAR